MKLVDLQRLIRTKAVGKALRNVKVVDKNGNALDVEDVVYDSTDDVVYITTK